MGWGGGWEMKRVVIVCEEIGKDEEEYRGPYIAYIKSDGRGHVYEGGSPDEAVGYLIREGLDLSGRLPVVLLGIERIGNE